MKEVLKFIILTITVLFGLPVFSQRVVNNALIPDIDNYYFYTDTMVAKSNLNTVVCYRCWKKSNGEDSSIFTGETTHDKKGRLTRMIQPGFTVNYKWLSDSILESMADYPPGSNMLEYFYIDTLIKGRTRRVCLYRADKNKHIQVRSVYVMGSNMWREIKRYDQDNKLVEINYPLGNVVAKEKQYWQETVNGKYDSVVTSNYLYDDYVNRSRKIYSKTGKLKEVWEIGRMLGRSDSSIIRSLRFYDADGRLIVQDDVDLDNQLTAELRIYYKDGKLIRYTSDDNFNDSLFAEQKMYNSAGQIIYASNYNPVSRSNFIYKYLFDDRNLLIRQEFYINDQLQYFQRYDYK
jgi:hypothetical protein